MFNCEVKVMYNKRLEMSQCSSITTKLLLNIPMLCKYLCLKNFFPCYSNHAFKPFFFFLILQRLPTCKYRVTTEKVLGIQVDE